MREKYKNVSVVKLKNWKEIPFFDGMNKLEKTVLRSFLFESSPGDHRFSVSGIFTITT